jgi:hypothetical protein
MVHKDKLFVQLFVKISQSVRQLLADRQVNNNTDFIVLFNLFNDAVFCV